MSTAKEKINEIAILSMMLGAGDEQGISMILKSLEDMAETAKSEGTLPRVISSVEWLIQDRKNLATPEFYKKLTDVIAASQAHADGQENVKFPNEVSGGSGDAKSTKRNSVVDESLLVEYIETHTLQLEEFESTILEYRMKNGDPAEFTATVKRYLHSLKGDSGAMGIHEVEDVCHRVEDILATRSASELTSELVKLKEWLTSALKCLTCKSEFVVSGDQFMAIFNAGESSEFAISAVSAPIAKPSEEIAPSASSKTYSLSGEQDIFFEFAAEAEEHLNNVESVILDSEGSYSKETTDTIFRGVHSLKGGSAYFTLKEMTETSHILENMLSEVRDGKREFDEELKALVLTYIDLQKGILGRAKKAIGAGNMSLEYADESATYLASLKAYSSGKKGVVPVPATSKDLSSKVESAPRANAEGGGEQGKDSDKLGVKNFVKVDTSRLDQLIDSIGEMVIYSSMLIRKCRELLGDKEDVTNITHRVEKFGRDLQDIGMSMRLVPIRGLFQKMSRLVWDASRKLGKDITFTMNGEDTELDRNLIDKLADPLMHMVRNSLDHGVEPPEEREKKGKPRGGHVTLSAYHSGGSIHIKIEDDGRGLNPDKLVNKAIERGILPAGAKLTNQEAFQLIFAAGFSTAAVVTDISGRGVGMDVVRRNVESLRGRIHIESTVDKGSAFTIELPLTLAIIDGIEIKVGGDHFIIPSLSIVEFIRPKADMITYTLDKGETFEFRGKYIPIFRLGDLYAVSGAATDPRNSTLVVVDNNQELVAFMVDDILGEYSTVIKSLGPIFEESKGVSGCAIMPNGSVALILDVRSLVQFARSEYRAAVGRADRADATSSELVVH